mgnify:CR=1 FL=1
MPYSLGPNTVRTLEQMGLGDEYNSVAETDDSGLFFQWWDGIKVHMGGEVSDLREFLGTGMLSGILMNSRHTQSTPVPPFIAPVFSKSCTVLSPLALPFT